MERVMVTSSNVKSVGYLDESQTLEVEFNNGTVYRYVPVEREDYDAIVDPANSAGRLVNGIKADQAISCMRVGGEVVMTTEEF